ncbi:pathogenesis-related BetVI family protein, partial [Salmonella enterica]|uniref:pathogenesis-related BetVI family protein n=1 Tax=Salmonella enterica TaxID=28901 RepID=UPI00289584A8
RIAMTFTVEVESPVSAARMFKAAVFDWHNIGPKIAPQIVCSATLLEGDGSVGSIRLIKFNSEKEGGNMHYHYIKEHLDFIDHQNFECKTTVSEGGRHENILETASVHYKIEPTSTGGCICKMVIDAKFKPGIDARHEEAKIKEHWVMHYKDVGAYLFANPDAYV